VVVAPTDEEAHSKLAQQLRYVSVEGTLARQSSLMQLDFGEIDIDAPLEYVQTDGIGSFRERFTVNVPDRVWTPSPVAVKLASSLGAIQVVGSPTTVADRLEELMSAGGQCCLVFTPSFNVWQGRRSIQLEIADFQPGTQASLS